MKILSGGMPAPLGITFFTNSCNFALYAAGASQVTLLLYKPAADKPYHEVPFDAKINKTGNIWHIELGGIPEGLEYAYLIDKTDGNTVHMLAIDPYARAIASAEVWHKNAGKTRQAYHPRGVILRPSDFDWQGVEAPKHSAENLIIYEMHVRGFTQDPSSQTSTPGTFAGVIEKIPYLKDLGINAIELLPVTEFNEEEYFDPARPHLLNYWGYSPVSFFALMGRYCSSTTHQGRINEFKTLVREMHRNGIEVILDAVFNHTGELDEKTGPVISYKALGPKAYYLRGPEGELLNYSGCGNTFCCSHPAAAELILSSLRYWASEMRVDGFRFDLASIFNRDLDGKPIDKSSLVVAIAEDPILSECKLIAEPWDAAGHYQLGEFARASSRFSEWNSIFRDQVRQFIKGASGQSGNFATRLCGSQDLFGHGTGPANSVNFLTAHDGFSLKDVVSYNSKHNEENGEENRDGVNDNHSWNCGIEGETDNAEIIRLRNKQMRNLFLSLMLSQGIPMIAMGDEYGHTKKGNNNSWCHDNRLNWFCWEKCAQSDFFRFCREAIHFRKETPALRRGFFLTSKDIEWIAADGRPLDWSNPHYVGFILQNPENGEEILAAFNAGHTNMTLHLPRHGFDAAWQLVIDTSAEPPSDFVDADLRQKVEADSWQLAERSAVVFKRQRQ